MTPDPRAPRLVRLILGLGVVLFWAVQLVLFLLLDFALIDSVLLAILLAAVPVFSLAQLPLVEDAVIERLPAYWGSIVTLWLLGTACWLVGTRENGAAAVGVVGLSLGSMVGWTLLLTAAALGTIFVFRQISIWAGLQESPLLRQLLPRTAKERRVFALLSVAAGAGEEIAYRGYAITVLAPTLGVSATVALTSVVFGIVHGYQGLLGVLRTGIMGAVLAWGFLAAGSLWPAIVAHALIDLLAGIVLGDRLMTPAAPSGVEGGPATPTTPSDPT